MKIVNNKNFYTGLIFLVSGSLAVLIARGYPMGTAARMGPGYFPSILGGILFLLGLFTLIQSSRDGDKVIELGTVRPIVFIPAAVVAFSFLVQPLGVVVASISLIVVGSLAGWQSRLREVVFLCIVLTLLILCVFVYGLKLPLKVWPI